MWFTPNGRTAPVAIRTNPSSRTPDRPDPAQSAHTPSRPDHTLELVQTEAVLDWTLGGGVPVWS